MTDKPITATEVEARRDAMTEKPKPCAHCGSDDARKDTMPYFNANRVMCWGCGIATQYEPGDKCLEKWNTRI